MHHFFNIAFEYIYHGHNSGKFKVSYESKYKTYKLFLNIEELSNLIFNVFLIRRGSILNSYSDPFENPALNICSTTHDIVKKIKIALMQNLQYNHYQYNGSPIDTEQGLSYKIEDIIENEDQNLHNFMRHKVKQRCSSNVNVNEKCTSK